MLAATANNSVWHGSSEPDVDTRLLFHCPCGLLQPQDRPCSVPVGERAAPLSVNNFGCNSKHKQLLRYTLQQHPLLQPAVRGAPGRVRGAAGAPAPRPRGSGRGGAGDQREECIQNSCGHEEPMCTLGQHSVERHYIGEATSKIGSTSFLPQVASHANVIATVVRCQLEI